MDEEEEEEEITRDWDDDLKTRHKFVPLLSPKICLNDA